MNQVTESTMSLFQFLKEIFKRYPRWILIIIGLLIVGSFLEAFSVATVIPLLSSLFQGSGSTGGALEKAIAFLGLNEMSISSLLLIIVGLVAAAELILYLSDVCIARICANISKSIKDDMLSIIFDADWQFHLDLKAGSVINLVSNESERVGTGVRYLGIYYSNFIIISIFITISLFVSWQAVALASAASLVALFIVRRINILTRNLGIKRLNAGNACNAVIVENMNNNRYIKSNNLIPQRLKMFYDTTRDFADIRFKEANYKAVLNHYNKVYIVVLIALLFFTYTKLFPQDTGNVLFILILLQRSYAKFALLQVTKRSVIASIPAYEHILDFMSKAERRREHRGALPYKGFQKGLQLDGAEFSYVTGKKVLCGVDMELPKSSITALVGPSGAGKSTIIDMLLGLIHPDRGRVMMDDQELKSIDCYDWRKHVGYVPQEPMLFNGSIRYNIALSEESFSDEEIVQAAKTANAHDFIVAQSDGYGTFVGDRGIKLSGGQKQRIALARALIHKPDLLILDEATSALDHESEAKIQKAIWNLKGRLTIFIVAHRLSTVENADRIYFLKDGAIVESGTFQELKDHQGEFIRMYNLRE